MNKNKKTYHIKETHNHTGKITLWEKPLYTPLEFAEELISYFAEKDGYIMAISYGIIPTKWKKTPCRSIG
jgi:hypothetical protein